MGAGAGRKNHRLTALQIEPCARPLLFLVSRGSDTRLSFVIGETPLDAPLDTGETPLDMGEILLPIDLLPLGVETPPAPLTLPSLSFSKKTGTTGNTGIIASPAISGLGLCTQLESLRSLTRR